MPQHYHLEALPPTVHQQASPQHYHRTASSKSSRADDEGTLKGSWLSRILEVGFDFETQVSSWVEGKVRSTLLRDIIVT